MSNTCPLAPASDASASAKPWSRGWPLSITSATTGFTVGARWGLTVAEKWLRVESGRGFRLVFCVKCGWREMVTTNDGVAEVGSAHLRMFHGDAARASNFASTRRSRS